MKQIKTLDEFSTGLQKKQVLKAESILTLDSDNTSDVSIDTFLDLLSIIKEKYKDKKLFISTSYNDYFGFVSVNISFYDEETDDEFAARTRKEYAVYWQACKNENEQSFREELSELKRKYGYE